MRSLMNVSKKIGVFQKAFPKTLAFIDVLLMHSEDLVEIRLYHLQAEPLSMRLLTTVKKPDWNSDFHFKDGVLALGWGSPDTFYVSIRRIVLAPDEVEAEVIMDLGRDMVCIFRASRRQL